MAVSSFPASPIRVLHVDDEPNQLRIIKSYIEVFDPSVNIETTTSPEEALRLLERESYDCLVSDYIMPEMNGIELALRVREVSDVPFILYTGRGSEEVASNAFAAGVDDYIRKEAEVSHFEILSRRIRASVEKSWSEGQQAVTLEILNVLNRTESPEEAIDVILRIVKKHTGAEAVGIRLEEGDDYPYYVCNGFSEEHILLENSLCTEDLEGQLIRDDVGNPVLECMCGNIIQGRFDPSKPFFTEGGSFWTNCTTKLLASTTEEDRQSRTRNVCNGEGYESVALIPLRGEDRNLGLLQLNDSRDGCFTLRMIKFLEGLGDSVGVAMARVIQERRLRESEERFRALLEESMDAIFVFDSEKYLYTNPRGAELLGLSDPDELVGRDAFEFTSPEDREMVRGYAIERQSGLDAPSRYEFDLVNKDGTRIPVETQVSLIEFDGKPASLAINRDITERKRMEKELRIREERLRGFMDSASDAFNLYDSELNLVDTNKAAMALFPPGTKKEDVIGKNILDLVPGLRESGRYEAYKNVVETGVSISFDEVALHPSFGEIYLAVKAFKVDEGLGIIGAEITGRKRMEEKLRDSERRYRSVFESTQEGIIVADPGGRIISANQAAVDFLGLETPEELMKRTTHEFFAEPGQREALMKELMEKEFVRDYEVTARRADGSLRTAQVSYALHKDDEGGVLRLEGIFRDITEQKRMEEELKESERRFKQLFEGVGDAVIVFGSQGKFLDCNEITLQLLGYSREEFLSLEVADLVHSDFHQLMKENQEKIWAGENTIVESLHRHKDGSTIPVEINAQRIEYMSEPAILAVLRDITERKRMEEDLRAYSESLEELVEEKTEELLDAERLATAGRVASMVVHDLRNPISSIRNALSLMELAPDKAEEAHGIIGDAVGRTLAMLDELSAQTRVMSVSLETFDLGELVENAVSEFDVPEGIDVVMEIGEELGEVELDPLMMRRVLDNLIRNAVEAIPVGGVLNVKAESTGDEAFFSVSDTGVGVSEKDKPNLYKPFYTTKPSGMGLGLAYCKRAVEAHGGEISFESIVGEGSTFRVSLPSRRADGSN